MTRLVTSKKRRLFAAGKLENEHSYQGDFDGDAQRSPAVILLVFTPANFRNAAKFRTVTKSGRGPRGAKGSTLGVFSGRRLRFL